MPDLRLVELDEVDSTNAHAERLASSGERGPLWIRAGIQTAGRGRKGRHWVSRAGNLYTTLLITPDAPPACLSQLGFVACLAVYDLAADLLHSTDDLSLKWPNDVLLGERKLSGILCESIAAITPDRVTVAVGCGINLAHAPAETRYGATCLADHGVLIEPADAWPHFREPMTSWLDVWNNGEGFTDIRTTWTERSRQVGTMVSLDLGGQIATGTFVGLADDGALVLEMKDGSQQLIRAGDVMQASAADQ